MADLGDGDRCDKDIKIILDAGFFENRDGKYDCLKSLEEVLDNLPPNLRRIVEKTRLRQNRDGSSSYSDSYADWGYKDDFGYREFAPADRTE